MRRRVTPMPRPFADGRAARVAVTALLGVAQAVFLGVMAFATRDAFVAIYAGSAPGWSVLATLAGAGYRRCSLRRPSHGFARNRWASATPRRCGSRSTGTSPACRGGRSTPRRLGALSLRFVGDRRRFETGSGRGLPRAVSAAMVLPSVTLVVFLLDPALGFAAAPAPRRLSLCVMGEWSPSASNRATAVSGPGAPKSPLWRWSAWSPRRSWI